MNQIVWRSFRRKRLRLSEKLVQYIGKINRFLKSRTIDSEHIMGIIYALLYLLPFMINKLVFAIVGRIFSYLPLSVLTVPLTMFIINLVLFICFVKIVVRLFTEKRFLLGVITLYLFFAFLLGMIFWFGSIFLSLIVTIELLFPDSIQSSELLNMMHQYSRNYQAMSDVFESYARIGAPILQFLGVSYLLNLFIPEKYQSIDLKLLDKMKRIFIKVGVTIIPLVAFIVFYHINRTTFNIIGLITVIATWLINPKNVVILINPKIKVSDDDIKPEILNRFQLLKLLISFIVAAWAISVYFFEEQNIEIRLYISLGLLLFFMILLTLWKLFLGRNEEKWLNKNLKDEVAQKFIEVNNNSEKDNN